jgi:S1-C subfamily serine protease
MKTLAKSVRNEKNSNFWIILIFLGFFMVLVVDTSFIIIYSVKISDLNQKIDSVNSELAKKINFNNVEIQVKISDLTKNLLQTKTDFNKEISDIKAKTSSDFSGIIETAVNSVVTVRTDVAQGTGFIISPNGYVVTNAHVLYDATFSEAITSDKIIHEMKLIGYDTNLDLALLKIEGNYQYLELDNSDNIKVGEKVIAIGNPLGLSFSVSEGIVSAVERTGSNNLPYYIQTDASLNPGNSGGPLINTNGKVIGINNFKARAESIGFALESNYIKSGINAISKKSLNQTILN